MYLRSVRISGFRSFAQPVQWDLDPGVNCITGPTGCGKSNLIEAVFWGLGLAQFSDSSENSCFFLGTDKHPPASRAVVQPTVAGLESSSSDVKFARSARKGEPPPPIDSQRPDVVEEVATQIHKVTNIDLLSDTAHKGVRGHVFVMDEMETNLSEESFELFEKSVRKLGQSNQFLVVTQRRPTMALADVLHFVTMESYGVSCLTAPFVKKQRD